MRKFVKGVGIWVMQGATVGLSALITVGLVSVALAALDFSDVPSNVTSGSQVSASAWNDLAYRVNKSVKQATQVITVVGSNVGIGTATPGQALSVAGTVESASGGFKFPDGTIQTSAATSAGKIVNVTSYKDCTRKTPGVSSTITMSQFAVNKLVSNSTLLIIGSVSGWGNYSGGMTQGWKYGSSAETVGQGLMYSVDAYNKTFPTQAILTGDTSTGTQTMTFRYYTANGSTTDRPFIVHNPNSTDDARLAQTCSVYTVFEIAN